MKKISIKREQSQAGLSFAERENRRSLAGGESKFRPQVKNKLLLLLVLLVAVVSGAWADEPPTYKVTLQEGTEDAKNWDVPEEAAEGASVTVTYNGEKKVKSVKAVKKADAWDGDLSKLTAESTPEFATATDGMTITGTLAAKVKVSIADGATVTLDNVTIDGEHDGDLNYMWAGLTCLGDATIILKDGTTNQVRGFHDHFPGIYIPGDRHNPKNNKTLIIKGGEQGTGMLIASNNGKAAGIGGV